MDWTAFRHIALVALCVTCVYTDIAKGKLFNWATYGGAAIGVLTALLLDIQAGPAQYGLRYTWAALIGAAVGCAILLVIHLTGGLGAGDVKFMAAVGALAPIIPGRVTSIGFVVVALVYAALIGAGMAALVLLWNGRLWKGIKGSLRALITFRVKPAPGETPLTIPFGVAIGIGAVWAWMEVIIR